MRLFTENIDMDDDCPDYFEIVDEGKDVNICKFIELCDIFSVYSLNGSAKHRPTVTT